MSQHTPLLLLRTSRALKISRHPCQSYTSSSCSHSFSTLRLFSLLSPPRLNPSIPYLVYQTRSKSTLSKKEYTPPSAESFARRETAYRRLQELLGLQKPDKIDPDKDIIQVNKGSKNNETEKDSNNNSSNKSDGKESAKEDPRKEAADKKTFQPAQFPIVLCHGFSGFDSLGTNPDFRFDYWYGVSEALDDIGCSVYQARVPPFAGIQQRAEALQQYIERTVPHGSELNLVGHSMGGLDGRYLISKIKSPHYKIRSLTTLGTPHHGSPFADYVMSDIVGHSNLETFWTIMGLVGIERGAAENLTTYYLRDEFNPNTPDDPDVAYFSYGASFQPGFFSRFRFPWQIIMEREGPNDGLVSVKSAHWGTYVRTIPNADHMDLMNWVNALAWSRARFPWILGGSSHDPEGRPKGAFETDNDEEGDAELPREELPLFNAIELFLEISDNLHKKGL